ncbi:XRE family transcriptional regulator [Streptomyces mexicanus]|uniref:XRE family transcriptional regulator n=2 Tax=Streptomyces mexicanus TaxID=178566 RepID=A0A7X1HWQ3_9ACTN|nr:XRE family transcriptional regulator [Streptomyces mexicanus]MBC2864452.1 XRE family transcriptional regulator [Streptomyces mexicanus]
MKPTRNRTLEAWMDEHGHSSNSLAEAVNQALETLTGKPGGLDGSSVRDWKAGRVRWPKSATRAALELVTGLPATALGFVPRGRSTQDPAPQQEDPMKRRLFVSGVAASALAAAAPANSAPRRIGMSDVERLQQRFTDVVASDHRHGGQLNIEKHASTLAGSALALQESGSATERVRKHLYGCAAAFRSSAMWAAIDGRRFDIAVQHMREAQALAEMSGDPAIKFRIWSHAGTMYRHMGRPAQALAANNVARSLHINRRDPMFASLGLARQMAIQGAAGDPVGTRRAYDEAQDAMDRADPGEYRPVWLNAFYDQAELDSLALSAYSALGDWEKAEYHAYRCLAGLRPHMRRSKAITTSRLARAQLEQGAIEEATATAMSVATDAATQHPRVALMLNDFGARLNTIAPKSTAAETWTDYARATWGKVA